MSLMMWRDYDAIAHDAVITASRGTLQIDYERAYKGHVEGKKAIVRLLIFRNTKQNAIALSIENRKANTFFSGEFHFV